MLVASFVDDTVQRIGMSSGGATRVILLVYSWTMRALQGYDNGGRKDTVCRLSGCSTLPKHRLRFHAHAWAPDD